jgi:SAM-dependent methyltransferase
LAPARPDWKFTGADVSALACNLARERTDAEIIEADASRLPLADGSLNAVACADVLYQVDDPAAVVAEFRRCLRPGGVVVAVAPAYRWLWSYHDEAVQAKRRFSRPEFVQLLAAAGFRVELATYLNMLPFPLVVLRRKVFPPARPTSDVRLYPWPLERFFGLLGRVEHTLLRAGLRLPFGSSVLVVARREG